MNKTIHRFSIGLSLSTLFLIFVGGLVKTTDSGLAVPDWPLSYGRFMPPMVGGIFYEHGHRMVATAVGFLTVLLAIFITLKEDRRWIKKAVWAAVGLVISQGVLGGLTVLFRLPPPISIAHACTAQIFFCLTLCLAVWTSRFWRETSIIRTESPPQRAGGQANNVPLHRLGFALVVVAFIQLLLGATLRHTGRALPFHISGGLVVTILAVWFARRVWRDHGDFKALRNTTNLSLLLLVAQLILGTVTFFLLNHRFEVIPMPFPAIATITAHVALGAMVFGISVIETLLAYRTRPENSTPIQTTLKDYFTLTKPGISFMAGITAFAGFILGSAGNVDLFRLFHTCVGTLMAAAGAGCLNMFIEQDTDGKMHRTQSRPLPSGRLQPGEVFFLGLFFSLASVVYLSWSVNFITAFFAALTLSVYLYIYTPLKKISGVCVTVGAVAGALPPVMGWTAATGQVSMAALVLFGILFFWQFPHFLSLAWLYKDDYAMAGLHMLPNPNAGDKGTARQMLWNSGALMLVSCLPTFLGLTGMVYLVTAVMMGLSMLWFSLGFVKNNSRPQARRIFLFSLLYVPLLMTVMLIT